MGKRSDFKRVPRDYYPTPIQAVEPLITHLPYSFNYLEPCAGDGRLISHISQLTSGLGECIGAYDIEPRHDYVQKMDALTIESVSGSFSKDFFAITNPPWDRKILHPLIDNFLGICPTWLLFDADWMHTKQSATFMTYCKTVVSVGRVKWIEGSKSQGKDNCAWYLFDFSNEEQTQFYGRMIQ